MIERQRRASHLRVSVSGEVEWAEAHHVLRGGWRTLTQLELGVRAARIGTIPGRVGEYRRAVNRQVSQREGRILSTRSAKIALHAPDSASRQEVARVDRSMREFRRPT